MHIPVLQKEVLEILDPKPNDNFIDATIGGGGHAEAILAKTSPNGKLLGIDRDEKQIKNLKLKIKNWEKKIILVCDNFADLKRIVQEQNFDRVNGILFDLGMSSYHIDESGRGFTFLKDEPLDMRFSLDNGLTAEYIVNNYKEEDIVKILREYGEERLARAIARRIVKQRPIKTTFELKRLIPKKTKPQRTFQALRIAVNDELNNLKIGLDQAADILEPGGRIAVISFHSLEDRIVKNFFKNNNKLQIITKKPLRPSEEEQKNNYRSHSAKIRGAVKK